MQLAFTNRVLSNDPASISARCFSSSSSTDPDALQAGLGDARIFVRFEAVEVLTRYQQLG